MGLTCRPLVHSVANKTATGKPPHQLTPCPPHTVLFILVGKAHHQVSLAKQSPWDVRYLRPKKQVAGVAMV